ncbi:MAG TPA: hypothetical protein VEZ71_11650, partial [Archangium sp.]|nr:hypothetical protein [Archangium sp.]
MRNPFRGLQLVLLLREDYLGRFRARQCCSSELLEHGFRLGPLTVREMGEVARRLAASGMPAQAWPEHELRELMLQVRMPGQDATDEAEVQTAFAQIVCRALWEERATGGAVNEPAQAEPILHRYLDVTLEGLGPLAADARRLLEEHLVASDGSRTLLTERQARAVLPEGQAERVLTTLERTAVLLAGEHHGSRYFELGHDWLAKKVFELRRERLRHEEEQRRLQRERDRWRRLRLISVVALAVAVAMGGLFLWALAQAERARNQSLMSGARELLERGQSAMAMKLLLEVQRPERIRGWKTLAYDALARNSPEVTFRTPGAVYAARFSPDGQHVVTA